VTAFDVYKPTQGKRTRWATFAVGLGLTGIGAYWLSERLEGGNVYVQYFVPLVVLAVLVFGLFRLINRPRMADFLIATEGEMKKVSWSSRKEIIGSTKVVIFTTFTMAIMLYVVDLVFQWFFKTVGVLRIGG